MGTLWSATPTGRAGTRPAPTTAPANGEPSDRRNVTQVYFVGPTPLGKGGNRTGNRRVTDILSVPGHGQDGHGTLPGGLGRAPGFSLLEMMAVVNLILLLAVFALPGFHRIILHSHEVVLREELFTLRNQINRFTHDYERGPASLDELLLNGGSQEPAGRAWSFSPRRASRGIGREPKFRPSSPVRGHISLGHLADHRKPTPPLRGWVFRLGRDLYPTAGSPWAKGSRRYAPEGKIRDMHDIFHL